MTIKPYIRKANYYETDQMGIIHHSNYIRWFEEARVDFMEQLGFGYEKAIAAGIDFALLHTHCEYKAMVRFNDTVQIYASISGLTASRMTVSYRVINAASGLLCTIGETGHFFYDGKKKSPVSLKKAIPELFELFSALLTPQIAKL